MKLPELPGNEYRWIVEPKGIIIATFKDVRGIIYYNPENKLVRISKEGLDYRTIAENVSQEVAIQYMTTMCYLGELE